MNIVNLVVLKKMDCHNLAISIYSDKQLNAIYLIKTVN